MLKIIPISALLLLGMGTAYAQPGITDNGTTVTTPGTPDTLGPSVDTNGTTIDTTPAPPATNGVVTTTPATSTDATITTTPATGVTTTTTPSTTTTDTTGVTTGTVTGTGTVTTTTPTTTSTTTTPLTVATAFACVGNNPAWNLSVSKQLITYSTPKDPAVKLRAVNPMTPMGDTTGALQVYTTRATNGKPVTILIRHNSLGCSNGLPGQSYQYEAFVVFTNMVITGCCNPV